MRPSRDWPYDDNMVWQGISTALLSVLGSSLATTTTIEKTTLTRAYPDGTALDDSEPSQTTTSTMCEVLCIYWECCKGRQMLNQIRECYLARFGGRYCDIGGLNMSFVGSKKPTRRDQCPVCGRYEMPPPLPSSRRPH